MNGIGGQQPINQPLITGDNKATDSNNVEASHGRFKISLPSGIRNFLSALLPSGIMSKSIQSYDVKPMPGMPQQSGTINKNSTSQNSGNVLNTPMEVAKNHQAQAALELVQDLLDDLTHSKGIHDQMYLMNSPKNLKQINTHIEQTREKLKSAVDTLNSMVGDNLKLDANEIEASSSTLSGGPGQTVHRSAKNNNPAKPSHFDNAMDAAANDNDKNAMKESFQKVNNSLEKVLSCKANLAAQNGSRNSPEMTKAHFELKIAKEQFRDAVQDFNNLESVDATLLLDANDIESALMYKDDKILQAAFESEAQQYKEIYSKFEQMKNTLI